MYFMERYNKVWQSTVMYVRIYYGGFFNGSKGIYITLLTSGRLNAYLADIDRQVQERLETLTEQMKQAQGITKQLKVENSLEWTQRMNTIRACAKEIVEKEIIFA